ncbi:MAG: hypothetical protein VXX81_07110 [Pseudomonadota bacterium]|nr:hypothetical protein [Pseudomonadota bacterium]
MRAAGLLAFWVLLAGCGPSEPVREGPWPERLSELAVLAQKDGTLAPQAGFAYTLAHPLFSDYAWKYRTVSLPEGGAASFVTNDDTLAFPVGTIITKTFAFPRGAAGAVRTVGAEPLASPDAAFSVARLRLMETRVLRHSQAGWEAVSYQWNEAGTEAFYAPAGALVPLTTEGGERFPYLIPDKNQCAGCHETAMGTKILKPIGPKPGNLAAHAFADGASQFEAWRAAGWVSAAAPATPWADPGLGGAAEAHAYLDANCAHCHSDTGAADTAGLDLRITASELGRGRCKTPVAAGRGSGGRAYDVWPGRPEASILPFRLGHQDPGIMMPELGRSLVHEEGVALVEAWITAMDGDCAAGLSL